MPMHMHTCHTYIGEAGPEMCTFQAAFESKCICICMHKNITENIGGAGAV
jgi:hypothetical protein